MVESLKAFKTSGGSDHERMELLKSKMMEDSQTRVWWLRKVLYVGHVFEDPEKKFEAFKYIVQNQATTQEIKFNCKDLRMVLEMFPKTSFMLKLGVLDIMLPLMGHFSPKVFVTVFSQFQTSEHSDVKDVLSPYFPVLADIKSLDTCLFFENHCVDLAVPKVWKFEDRNLKIMATCPEEIRIEALDFRSIRSKPLNIWVFSPTLRRIIFCHSIPSKFADGSFRPKVFFSPLS